MNVTIIGAGHMGRAIGRLSLAGGHSVTLVGDKSETVQKAAEELQGAAKNGSKVSTASLENVEPGDVVVLALWYGTNTQVVKQLGSKLNGKIVVDIANPLNSTYDGLATPPDSSSAEEIAKAVPGAKVIKAFNTTFAGTLNAGQVADQPLDVFVAGDDEDAKKTFAQLVRDAGLRPVDVGPLERARHLEGLQLLHIAMQNTLGTNWSSTVKVLA